MDYSLLMVIEQLKVKVNKIRGTQKTPDFNSSINSKKQFENDNSRSMDRNFEMSGGGLNDKFEQSFDML